MPKPSKAVIELYEDSLKRKYNPVNKAVFEYWKEKGRQPATTQHEITAEFKCDPYLSEPYWEDAFVTWLANKLYGEKK